MNLSVVSPILGFESIKEFEFTKIDDYFSKIESGGISFTLINPTKVREYDIGIDNSYASLLQLDEDSEVELYCIVILDSDIKKSHINFLAPIVINKEKSLLVQVALDSNNYSGFGVLEPISNYL